MSGPEPERLPTGTVPRDQAGFRWWRYQRPEPNAPALVDGAPSAESHPLSRVVPSRPTLASTPPEPGLPVGLPDTTHIAQRAAPLVVLAGLVAAVAIACGQLVDSGAMARVLVGAFGVIAAAGFARYVQGRHREEPWIGRYIVWGIVVKLAATVARYYAFVGNNKRSDAQVYGGYAEEYVQGIAEPLENLRKTNFIRYLTAHVYVLIGTDLIAAFLVFGIVAFFGAYLWYRAAAEAVPSLNRKWYCAFMFFAPSLAFWPSSVGKEAVMLLALGLAALGTAKVLNGRLLQGFLIAVPGGWLLWVVRPHLLAFVTVAAAAALFVRRGAAGERKKASLGRPIGLLVLGLLAVFAVSQAADFLGMDDFSLTSIEEELADQSQQTNTGGSRLNDVEEPGKVNLTPLSVPQGVVTVLLRPFPWEVENSSQIIACVESAVFAWFVVWRFRSIVASLRQIRGAPYLFFCWVMLAFYALAFSSFSNMGLLVRQRSLILPAFFVLLCVEPRREDEVDDVTPEPIAGPVRAGGVSP